MKFFEKAEQRGRWPQQTCTTFFLIPKNVTSECSVARHLDSLVGVVACEGVGMAGKTSCWDATHGRNGGAVRIAWETLLEMERCDCGARAKQTKERSQRCLAWLTHSSRSISLLCGLGRRIAIFPRRLLQNAKVFVDDLTASMDGGNNESTCFVGMVLELIKRKVYRSRKEMDNKQSKVTASC